MVDLPGIIFRRGPVVLAMVSAPREPELSWHATLGGDFHFRFVLDFSVFVLVIAFA